MFTVGLTGNIAAGKSSVAQVWRALGAHLIDADVLARRAVEPGTPALREIARAFGNGVLREDGSLDRAALRAVVFADAAARERLERIVHPAVAALRDGEMEVARAAGAALVVADIPLLFEVGRQGVYDRVVLVDAPTAERLRRLVENRSLTPAEAERIIAAQMPAERKRDLADIVIDNAGTESDLRRRAAEVWERLVREAAAHPPPGAEARDG